MKKLFSIFAFSFAAAPLLAAVSTCETRVDKHPGASTAQRVNYCLTEDPQTQQDTPVTQVILSDVYDVQYPQPKTAQPAPTQETKIYQPNPISMEYLDKDDYPAFRNDIMPQINAEQAHTSARNALNTQTTSASKGKKSLQKPQRQMKEVSAQEETAYIADTASYAAQPDYTTAYGSASGATAYSYPTTQSQATPTGTPAAQIQQAQALQNDPLYQNNTDNGAAPAGFTDGGVMGPSGFGYNATDPAFQP